MNIQQWKVGFTADPSVLPEYTMPAQVPGAVQADYARYHEWPPFTEGVNVQDYAWMENMYWLYTAPLSFETKADEAAFLVFKGIDYRYRISVNGEVLCQDEGMFSTIRLDVTRFAGKQAQLEVLLSPVPKCDDSNCRDQGRKSVKAVACYGWDWHPRLATIGIWDDVSLEIENEHCITDLEASYVLADDEARIDVSVHLHKPGPVHIALMDGNTPVAEADCDGRATLNVSYRPVSRLRHWCSS